MKQDKPVFKYKGYSIARLNQYNLALYQTIEKPDNTASRSIIGYHSRLKTALAQILDLECEQGNNVDQVRSIITKFEAFIHKIGGLKNIAV